MKTRPIVVLAFVAAFAATATAQNDTIAPCQRAERYIYDSLWADDFSQYCNGYCDIRGAIWHSYAYAPSIVLRRCIVSEPVEIAGIAAPIHIDTFLTMSSTSRLDEEFYLYVPTDTGLTLLATATWRDGPTRKYMQMYGPKGAPDVGYSPQYSDFVSTYPVYEAYFDKPITVCDTFYVGGSSFNNYRDSTGLFAHPGTRYLRWVFCTVYGSHAAECTQNIPRPTYDLIRYVGTASERLGLLDTAFRSDPGVSNGFGCIFPIRFVPNDSTTHQADTCIGTTGLRVLDNSGRNVALTWNDDGNSQWELSIVKGDTSTAVPNEGNVNTYTTNFARLYGLDSAWYTVFLRTVCNADEDLRSPWSDTVHFLIPQPDTAATGFAQPAALCTTVSPNPANQSISIASSYNIRKVTIVSADGKTLYAKECNGCLVTVDIGMLPDGPLFVTIDTEGGTVTKKLIKRK